MNIRLFFTLASLAACGGGTDSDDEMTVNCALESRDDEFVVGLAKTGQQVTFTLLSASPAPPARGDNTFVLQLDTANGPLSNASMRVTPFMPDHGHGTAIPVGIQPLPEAGQYELAPVNLWMPALWEITLSVTSAPTDSAVFRFCIPG